MISGAAFGCGGSFDADGPRGSHRALRIIRIEPDIEAKGGGFREAEADVLKRSDRDGILHDAELRKPFIAGKQFRPIVFKHPQTNGVLIQILPADFVADLHNQVTRRDIRSDVEITY